MAEENEFKFPEPEELKKIKDFQIQENGTCKDLKARSYQVHRYSELVYLVSLLSSYNQDKMLLFRGQKHRYPTEGTPTFYPTIYRNIKQDSDIEARFKRLEEAVNLFKEHFPLDYIDNQHKASVYQCFVQHYHAELEIGTPWLDLTQSLRIATSFIRKDTKADLEKESGYVYVFALPYFNQAITEGNLNYVRLLSLSSSISLLPPLQEGYLVRYDSQPKNQDQLKDYDFNKYLLAEVNVTNLGNESYWHIIPPESFAKSKFDFANKEIKKLKRSLKF